MRSKLSLLIEASIALAVAAYFLVEGFSGSRALNIALAVVGMTSLVLFLVALLEGASNVGPGHTLYPIEWVLCGVWTLVWCSLAYIALTGRGITLGAGKFGLGGGHAEGAAAIAVGFIALGAAVCGIGWLLRVHRYRRLLRLGLLVGWLGSVALYLSLAG
ncbi:MAG TPA: hypothetical protein VGX52_05215 [Burkholderiales bacterium]|nr:hypothetical protein [Burkholderiales bacterium]